MRIVVLADESTKSELLSPAPGDSINITWIRQVEEFLDYPEADVFMDLLYEPSLERTDLLSSFPAKPVIVNAVIQTLSELPEAVVRINGWKTFLSNKVIEGSGPEDKKAMAEKLFSCFGKKISWVPDIPGFISPRVIAMIINEAFYALEDKVSTREEIDTAMKLGTNYPYGPFEWCSRIGPQHLLALLETLSLKDIRYMPAGLLKKEALS